MLFIMTQFEIRYLIEPQWLNHRETIKKLLKLLLRTRRIELKLHSLLEQRDILSCARATRAFK